MGDLHGDTPVGGREGRPSPLAYVAARGAIRLEIGPRCPGWPTCRSPAELAGLLEAPGDRLDALDEPAEVDGLGDELVDAEDGEPPAVLGADASAEHDD